MTTIKQPAKAIVKAIVKGTAKSKRTWPASFAPGRADPAPLHVGVTHEKCPGCLGHPSPLCAACGGPTAHIVPTGDGTPGGARHALTLCEGCYAVLLSLRNWAGSAHSKPIAGARKVG